MKKLIISILCFTAGLVYGQQVRTINMVAEMQQILLLDGGGQTEFWGYGVIRDNGAYSATLPGPVLEINKGDSVVINFYNDSPEDHTIHLHGLDVNQANDGVPSTSFAVSPQDTTTYSFMADYEGVYLYHCHVLTTLHLTMGMYGMIVVNNYPDSMTIFDGGPHFTNEFSFLTSDMDLTWNNNVLSIPPMYRFKANYFMVNGKSGNQLYNSGPEQVQSYVGDTTVLRLGNMAYSQTRYIFPPELNARAYMSDGRVLANAFDCDTLEINAGERYTVVLIPDENIDTDILVDYFEARNGNLEHTNHIKLNGDLNMVEGPVNDADIYPNPTTGLLHFYTPKPGSSIEIYNLSGQLVLKTKAQQVTNLIDLSGLTNGVYILKHQQNILKLIKQ